MKNDYLLQRSSRRFVEEVKQRNYEEVSSEKILEIIGQIKTLESLSQNKKNIIVLICLNQFKLLYISANVKDKLGYDQEEALMNNDSVSKLYSGTNLNLQITALKWGTKVRSLIKVDKKDTVLYLGGRRLYNKMGESSKYFFRSVPLDSIDKENSLILGFYEDINHLMKHDDFTWAYYVVEKEEGYNRYFSKNTGEKGLPSIITVREREVLEQMNLGKSTKEISTLLDISINTVERHRKNMLAKLGAKDSTALIQLCKMCGVL